jgi:hypothetical protein
VDIAWIIICCAQEQAEEALKTIEDYRAKCSVKQEEKKKVLLHTIVVELPGDL